MDQDQFRALLATPRHPSSSGSPGSARTFGQTPRRSDGSTSATPSGTGNKYLDGADEFKKPTASFKPRKFSKGKGKEKEKEKDGEGDGDGDGSTVFKGVGGTYRDRAKERRLGKDNEFTEVEKLLEDFKARPDQIQDKESMEEQMKYLGGDAQHSILVKGLDYALLRRTRHEMDKEEEKKGEEVENELEDVFASAGPSSASLPPAERSSKDDQGDVAKVKKKTKDEIIRDIKRAKAEAAARASGSFSATSSETHARSTEEYDDLTAQKFKSLKRKDEDSKMGSKFKPIKLRPIGEPEEDEGRKKKKKKKKRDKDGVKDGGLKNESARGKEEARGKAVSMKVREKVETEQAVEASPASGPKILEELEIDPDLSSSALPASEPTLPASTPSLVDSLISSAQAIPSQTPEVPAPAIADGSKMDIDRPSESKPPPPPLDDDDADDDIFAGAAEYDAFDSGSDSDSDSDSDADADAGSRTRRDGGSKRKRKEVEDNKNERRNVDLKKIRLFDDDEEEEREKRRKERERLEEEAEIKRRRDQELLEKQRRTSSSSDAGGEAGLNEDGEEQPMRLVPLASSSVPSIKDILAMDDYEAKEQARKAKKEKYRAKAGLGAAGGGGGGGDSDEDVGGGSGGGKKKKQMSEKDKLERDYKKLNSYMEKKKK